MYLVYAYTALGLVCSGVFLGVFGRGRQTQDSGIKAAGAGSGA